MSAPIGTIQRHLERIYEIAPGCYAERFLVTGQIAATPASRPEVEEQLLLREDGDALELGLFLSTNLLERLRRDDPLTRLHDGNLADLCLATEGVSHFLYVAWRAPHDQPVTRLELELQAEVDKFMLAWLLLGHQQGQRPSRGLHRRLFHHCRVIEPLPHPERQRYHQANAYAAAYCGHLRRRYLRARHPGGLWRELRRFYRLRHRAKLDHITARTRLH
jgi:hypothetical protein